MKNIVILFLTALMVCSAAAQKQKPGVVYDAKITRVIDGDTVAFQASWLPEPLKKELSIRVFGVDTPEKGFRAKCAEEAQLGELASDFTKHQVAKSKTRQILLIEWDKYGGRVLGDIILDGESLRLMLIQAGFAKEYYGEAKQSWCK